MPTAFSMTGLVNPATGLLDPTYVEEQYHFLSGSFGSKIMSDVVFESLQSRSVGTVTGDVGRLKLGVVGGSQIEASTGLNGGKSWRHSMDANEFPKLYIQYSQPTQRGYHSCWFKFGGDLTGTSGSWKFGRFGTGEVYHPNRYAHMYTSSGGSVPASSACDLTVDTNGIVRWAANNEATDQPNLFTQNTWHFYEIECNAGTVNGNDSTFKAYIDGVLIVQFTGSSLRTTANPSLITWCLSALTGLANAVTNTIIFNLDDFYFDSSRSRVVLTNNATYSSSTKFAIQPIIQNGWSADMIICRKNGASFTIGDTAHIHVFNDNGDYLGVFGSVTVDANYLRI
jgi:hypothetical protein